jgi:MFS family permease
LSWIIWGLAAAFYFSGFYQRVAPAVMTDQLMRDFEIGAAALGNLSAFYFYSYVAMQIPTGILADQWGARRLLSLGAVVAALGTFLFAAAPDMVMAGVGRLLIGGAVGVAWVALLKLSIHWFPPGRYALASGLGLFVGVSGAVSAGVPLRLLVDSFGWRPVMGVSGGVTLLTGILIWLIVRDDPGEKGYAGYAPPASSGRPESEPLLLGLRTVLRYQNTWFLSIAPMGILGPLLAFAGLWGVPFLSTHYAMSPAKSAAFTSALLVSWAIGGPAMGAISDKVLRRKSVYLCGSFASCLGWALVLYVPDLPLWALGSVLTVIGFSSGVIIIGFAFAKESVPVRFAGTVSGVCNMGYMLGPMILQPLVGWILDLRWNGAVENGVRIYDLGAYHLAFSLLAGWSVMGLIVLTLTTETHCRQMAGVEGE